MGDSVDYVLVYEHSDYGGDEDGKKTAKMDNFRKLFAACMITEHLQVKEERVGKYVFVKISCPLDRLHREAEVMRIDLPLYGMEDIQDPEEQQEALFEKKIQRILNGKQETTVQVTAPFRKNCLPWFTHPNSPHPPVLWSALRCLAVYNILINININETIGNKKPNAKQGLSYLLMIGAYSDSFILHEPSKMEPVSMAHAQQRSDLLQSPDETSVVISDPREELAEMWGSLFGFRRQPLLYIRNYYGEKIAFYFAWVGTLISSLWIPAILGLAVFVFGVSHRLNTPTGRGFLYYVEIMKSSSDNILTPGFAAIICLWGTILMEIWKRKQISLAYQWYVENFDMVEPDRPQFYTTKRDTDPQTKETRQYYPLQRRMLKYFTSTSVLLLMVMLVFISVTAVILYRVYMTVSFCVEGDGLCDLLHGTVIATFLNTVSIMILGKAYEYIAVKLTDWENHQTLSEYNDALIIKLFAFQFANTYASLFYTAFFRRDLGGTGILGMGANYTDNCGAVENSNCMSMLSFQLLMLMIVKPFPKFCRDVVIPWFKVLLRRCGLNEIADVTTDRGITKQHYLLREKLKPAAEDFRLGEFTEKIILYGCVMLFAASFPLAPLLALLYNIVDLRIDAKRLLWWNRRPVPFRDNDIGIWFHIINFINICGVVSNAFLIAFNSELGRNESLQTKLAIVIGFEHFIFLVKFLISLAIPDIPTWVRNFQRKGRFLVSLLMTKCEKNGIAKCDSLDPSNPSGSSQNPVMLRQPISDTTKVELPKSRWSYG